MPFVKQDMSCMHYSWETEDNPGNVVFSGEPSRRIFDPSNGYQVLFMINCYASVNGQLSLDDAHLLENRIAQKLPLGLMSERSVFKWIMESQ